MRTFDGMIIIEIREGQVSLQEYLKYINIDRDQKKSVSTVFIRGNEITQKIDVCVFAFI